MLKETTQAASFTPSLGLAEQIADHVQKQIVTGELQPGDRIAETHITEELGVSRGPVRESLRVLSRRHLVDLLPRKGARVSDFGPDDVDSLYDLQAVLMSLLLRRIGERWQPGDLEIFSHLLDDLNSAVDAGKPLELLELSFDFQSAACNLAGNSYLTAMFVDLQPSFSRAYYLALSVGQDEMQGLTEFISSLIEGIVNQKIDECLKSITRFSDHQRALALSAFAS